MTPLKSWCAAMEKTSKRRIILSNLIHDLRQGRFPKDALKRVLTHLGKRWKPRVGRAPEKLLEELGDRPRGDFVCLGLDRPKKVPGCSRVLDEKSFLTNNLIRAPYQLRYTDEIPEAILEHIESYGFRPGSTKGQMRGRRPFAWVTPTAEIDKVRRKTSRAPEKLPSLVRDLLGLRHYNDDEKLVELVYPKGALKKGDLAAPTFLEGCPGLIYRSVRKADGWGRTVDLRTGEEGLKEAVHRPVPFEQRFRLRRIGRLASRKEDFRFEELLTMCPTPWKSEYAEDLEAMVP